MLLMAVFHMFQVLSSLFIILLHNATQPSSSWRIQMNPRHGWYHANMPNRPKFLIQANNEAKDYKSNSDYLAKVDEFHIRTRTLFLSGELNDEKSYRLINQIFRMNEENPNENIKFYINSPGGSVSAGLAIYDILQSLKMRVETICIGQAASMGAFLLAAGAKGLRSAMPNSRIMIHQPLGGAHGEVTDIKIQANEILHIRQILNAHFSHFTGKSIEQVEQDCERDYYMRPSEAMEYGLIDRICTTRTSHIPIPTAPIIE